MLTVGRGLVPLSPVAAWVVVVAQSVVLFLFASVSLEHFLASNGLPTIPLVPVSSSQAVVGAVIGIGLLQGRRNIRWSVLGNISLGWLATPLISALVCFVALFFLQNVFNQQVFSEVQYKVTGPVIDKLAQRGYATASVRSLEGQAFTSEMNLMEELAKHTDLSYQERYEMAELAKMSPVRIDPAKFEEIRKSEMLTQEQLAALETLAGRSFDYPWMLADALGDQDPAWKFRTANTVNKMYNKELRTKLDLVLNTFGRP